MKILHITAHLGGGVGKAHAAIRPHDAPDIERQYLLLEAPRDSRHADALAAVARISMADGPEAARDRAAEADIVQIEWWNHPRLYAWLCAAELPATRTIIWSHISGLAPPYLPAALPGAPHRLLFTAPCSLNGPAVRALDTTARAHIGVVNSGFGFGPTMGLDAVDAGPREDIAYLGTVDFSKMSPQLFDVVDRAALDRPVSLWGGVSPDGEVARRVAAMAMPGRVRLRGHADDPQAVLRAAGILLYLLRPDHFGTAENALVEAMSVGCVPLVFDNPAERAIVVDGENGFVVADADAAVARLRWMVDNPSTVRAMGARAIAHVAATRTPARSAAALDAQYRAVMAEPRRRIDYPAILGATPAEWFLATQDRQGAADRGDGAAHKGSLAHFRRCFPDDAALATLAGVR